MRYSTETRFRKYFKSYSFLSFARKLGNKNGTQLMDTATKTGIDAAKTASKRVVQKTAEAITDLIVNKIADKINSIGKPKEKEKTKEIKEIYISPEKRQQILMTLDCLEPKMWHHCIKMEFQKIKNFLVKTSDDQDFPRFVTKKWVEVCDQSGKNYNTNEEIRIKISMLRSDLCDFSDAYIVVKGTITIERPDNTKKKKKRIAFKSNAPFINCISKINGVKVDNVEDLNVIMPMQNLLEYSKNYGKTTESLWNYYRDKPSNILSSNSESLKYKTGITGNTYNVGVCEEGYDANKVGKNETEVVFPLKHLSNFWKSLNIALINCEVELILTWSKNCVLANMTRKNAEGTNPTIVPPTELKFEITDTKLYVPVVTLSKENDTKLLEQLKTGFKRTIKWGKYRSQMTIQPQNNKLNYLIDPTFTNGNGLIVLSFQRIARESNTTKDYRDSFSHYYVPSIEIKDFNV